MNFEPFALAIHKRFKQMIQNELFVVDFPGDEIWQKYLEYFPLDSNPVYRERTEHDCSCCRNFIRNIGNVVNIVDDRIVSLWGGAKELEYPYSVVAKKLDNLVRCRRVAGLFRTKEGSYGAPFTMEAAEPPKRWHHFHTGPLPAYLVGQNADSERGRYSESVHMFERALTELNSGALTDILGLIDDKMLYRGEEHRNAVQAFRETQNKYFALPEEEQNNFIWRNACDMQVSRFRNTVIGTLAVDLSESMPLEDAVRAFEQKVAPQNYKRPASLITPSMIQQAERTANELGLLPTFQRRFAQLSDISVQDVLWVDGSKRDVMKQTSPFTSLLKTASAGKKATPAAPSNGSIGIDEFMQEVLPGVTTMEVMVKNIHQGNFVSLTAPMEFTEHRLFKWNNPFAWSYAGNVTDSIKERVKRAGGNTGAALRVSLAWFNKDDLDLHSTGPHGHVFFAEKKGILDVDMNVSATTREPVENQSWTKPMDGTYAIVVNQYNQRETIDTGFTLELECNGGEVTQWNYPKPAKGQIECLHLHVKHGRVERIGAMKDLVSGSASRERWGIATENFVKVNTVLLSPNHWSGQAVGNRHYIFALDGCVNDEPTRGFYNEYLNSVLEKHRKVFEVLGSKTLCPPSTEQVSGVGFSSTRGDLVTVRADKRIYEVQF